MIAAPTPEDDTERLAELHALGLLDTSPEERFDRIIRLLTLALKVPLPGPDDPDEVWRFVPRAGGPAGLVDDFSLIEVVVDRRRGPGHPPEPRIPTDLTMIIATRSETTADVDPIHEVNRLAFGRDDEARLDDDLRDGGYVRSSLVAEDDGRIVGHILFSDLPIITPGGRVDALALAPLAVAPSHQRRGIGSMLVEEGLRACRGAGHRIIVVLGRPEIYTRFGFSAEVAGRLRSPYSGPAFMAVELVPEALEGVEGEVSYPPPFGAF